MSEKKKYRALRIPAKRGGALNETVSLEVRALDVFSASPTANRYLSLFSCICATSGRPTTSAAVASFFPQQR